MTTKSQDTTCCNHDCNQGRTCPVRLGTYKPVEAVHQISDPSAPDYIALAHASGAIAYSPAPMRVVRGLTFTFAQLGDFVARVQAHAAPAAQAVEPAAAPDMRDAYVGAREDLAIWKRRALEAERQLRVAPAPAAVAVPDVVIAGAVFDFAGYLTTLPLASAITASEAHEASPMVDALKAWSAKRSLKLDDADVSGWRAATAAIPPTQAQKGQASTAYGMALAWTPRGASGQDRRDGAPERPSMTAAQDSRAQFEDGAWYWVEKEVWIGDPPTIAPACYKAECDAWYSFAFSGIPTREVNVLEPCRRAALSAEPVAYLVERHAFRVSPDGQDADGNSWLEECQQTEPGAFPVYGAPQPAAQDRATAMQANRQARDDVRRDLETGSDSYGGSA